MNNQTPTILPASKLIKDAVELNQQGKGHQVQKPAIPIQFLEENLDVDAFNQLVKWLDQHDAPEALITLVHMYSWSAFYQSEIKYYNGKVSASANLEAPYALIEYLQAIDQVSQINQKERNANE